MLKKLSLVLFILLIGFISNNNGQSNTISIDKNLLEKILLKADSKVMLKQVNGSIYALDSKRNTLYPAGYVAPQDEVFIVFDTSYLRSKLLELKNSRNLGNDISLSTDSWPWCPPDC